MTDEDEDELRRRVKDARGGEGKKVIVGGKEKQRESKLGLTVSVGLDLKTSFFNCVMNSNLQ